MDPGVHDSIRNAIPAEFHMISGSHDSQTSADAYNVGNFQLPNPAGKAGGACTSALLQVLYKDGRQAAGEKSWVSVLREMRSVLRGMGYDVSFLFHAAFEERPCPPLFLTQCFLSHSQTF
jgi:hypothetical protein